MEILPESDSSTEDIIMASRTSKSRYKNDMDTASDSEHGDSEGVEAVLPGISLKVCTS
jgi:hypothetical protein